MTTREEQKLAKYERLLAREDPKWYLPVLLTIIVLIHMADGYISDISAKVQSLYMQDLLIDGQGMSQVQALQFIGVIQLIGAVAILVSPFYKVLIDRLGRKPIFIINLFGMGIGCVICNLAPNIWIFILGLVLVVFFVIHDLQILYIFEAAPAKWRSTLYGLTSTLGVLGTLAIPALRSVFITETEKNWRPLYLVPGVFSVGLGIIAVLLVRESRVFVKSRVDFLTTPPEQRAKDAKGRDLKGGGLVRALKYMFGNRQMRWLSIAMFSLMTAAVAVTSYFEPFMKYAGLSDGQITQVLFAQPVIMAVVYFACGFLADLIGRKKTALIFGVITLASAIGFVLLVQAGAAPVGIGIVFGFLISSFWSVSNTLGMMYAESTPTEVRGSVTGAQAFVFLPGQLLGLALYTILIRFISLGTYRIAFAIPGIVVCLAAVMIKVRETKGVDMEHAGMADDEVTEAPATEPELIAE